MTSPAIECLFPFCNENTTLVCCIKNVVVMFLPFPTPPTILGDGVLHRKLSSCHLHVIAADFLLNDDQW